MADPLPPSAPSPEAGAEDRSYAAHSIATALREAILAGKLAPAQHIRQESVAREHGTSRVPVREALLALEREGLVTLVPNAGARVARLEPRELEEVYLLREQIEPFLIARSAPLLSAEQIGSIESLQGQMEALSRRSSASVREPALWLELDRRFHLATFEGADLPRFRKLAHDAWTTTQQYRRAYVLLPDRIDLVHAEHRLLIDALRRQDPEDAARILATHIRRVRVTLLADHQELFPETG